MQGLKDKVKIPADIPEQVATDIQTMTKTSYQILKCEGGAPRVDWLYNEKDNMLYINEINTIP
ncbi:MAG: hypothetical protein H6767_01350 [Candidatus Peribacteria bacterium]|nr:MAG: hypothetical protein H6767_01350 [Candidatus Peribacteria bacterium]